MKKILKYVKQLGFQIVPFDVLFSLPLTFVKDNIWFIKSFFGGLQTFLGGIVSGFMNGLGMIRKSYNPYLIYLVNYLEG